MITELLRPFGKHKQAIFPLLIASILTVLIPPTALGQGLAQEEVMRYRREKLERETERMLEARKELGQRFLYDYGGFYRFSYMFWDDLNNEAAKKLTRVLKYHDLRLWGTLNIDGGIHNLYLRTRLEHSDYNRGSEFRDDEDVLDFEIDQGYYQIDVKKALKRYLDADLPLRSLKITGGKFWAELGNALSYSRLGMGAEIVGQTSYFDFKLFWHRTPPGESNIDYSAPGFRTEGQTRDFIGAQITIPRVLNNHYPYVYFLDQRDRSHYFRREDPQRYDYDSQYFGIGSQGRIVRNLTYSIEGVREIGRSYADISRPEVTGQEPQDISAWSLNAQLEKVFDVVTHPRLRFQYAFGTGDKERRLVTNTGGGRGNSNNTDRNFLYWGYIDTGHVVVPRLSNLQMLRFELALSPLEFTKRYKKTVQLGAVYYLFHKYTKTGGISDYRANLTGGHPRDADDLRNIGSLGKEVDVYLNWKVLSDIFVDIRYGRFYPSNAYGDKSARDFFLAGITFQF